MAVWTDGKDCDDSDDSGNRNGGPLGDDGVNGISVATVVDDMQIA